MPIECTRSHPHELMDDVCVEKTESARLRSALAEKTAQVERMRAALEDRSSFYYARGVPHQSQHPHCRCRDCVDARVKEALAATAPSAPEAST